LLHTLEIKDPVDKPPSALHWPNALAIHGRVRSVLAVYAHR
jgi:hypothetical protein